MQRLLLIVLLSYLVACTTKTETPANKAAEIDELGSSLTKETNDAGDDKAVAMLDSFY